MKNKIKSCGGKVVYPIKSKWGWVVTSIIPALTTKIKVMRDFDKEYKEHRADMWEMLILGAILGFIAGMLLT